MIPQSLKWSVNPFLVGGFLLALGCLAAGAGFQIKSRTAERHRDRLYVLKRRGEDVPAGDPPRVASVLQYLGGAVAFVGVVVLVAAWTSAAGQS